MKSVYRFALPNNAFNRQPSAYLSSTFAGLIGVDSVVGRRLIPALGVCEMSNI